MAEFITFNTISQVHQSLGLPPPQHPLVTVIHNRDIRERSRIQGKKVVLNLYQVLLKKGGCGPLKYGRSSYDYLDGTLLFMEPGQVIEYMDELDFGRESNEEWSLGFHPDLLLKSNLGFKFDTYSFFRYDTNEALHLSDGELKTIEELLDKIVKEYSQNLDRHSQNLITTNIELLLDYCVRFYDRQFYTRTNLNTGIVSRFDQLIRSYYKENLAEEMGIPAVSYCARELNLTPGYFGDLIKKETGVSPQEHIHNFIIERAKLSLLNSDESVSQIGYGLGFGYPQHFSNLFKAKTGMSPREFRNSM